MNTAALNAEFNRLKGASNMNGLERLAVKINKAGGRTGRIIDAIESLLNAKFTDTINAMSPSLLQKKGIEIRVEPRTKNYSTTTHFVALVKNGKDIAGIDIGLRVSDRGGAVNKWVDLNFGWTLSNYSKNGPMRPNSGPGYGTIIRALVLHAARKIGCMAAIQDSAIVSNENKNKFARGNLKRPVSAWIMNKLGFSVNSVNKEPGTNKIKSEHRTLRLNKNTPQLNAVIRNILN